MEDEKKYIVSLNRTQLHHIATALELQARMRCGQIELSFLRPLEEILYDKSNRSEILKEVKNNLKNIKKLIFGLDQNDSYGIGHNPDADLEYEIYKMILSKFEEEYEKECIKKGEQYRSNVNTGKPLKVTNIPFIKINEIFNDKFFENLPKK